MWFLVVVNTSPKTKSYTDTHSRITVDDDDRDDADDDTTGAYMATGAYSYTIYRLRTHTHTTNRMQHMKMMEILTKQEKHVIYYENI